MFYDSQSPNRSDMRLQQLEAAGFVPITVIGPGLETTSYTRSIQSIFKNPTYQQRHLNIGKYKQSPKGGGLLITGPAYVMTQAYQQ